MRALALAALVAAALVAAAPALAQSSAPFPPPGPYVDGGLGVGWSSSSGLLLGGTAALGYQLPEGLDLAVRTLGVRYGDDRGYLAFQPEVGYTRALGDRTALSARLGARGTMAANPIYREPDLAFRSVAGVGHVAVARQIDLARDVRLIPTVGAYGGVGNAFDTEFEVADGGLASFNGSFAEAGVLAGLQLEFKAIGARFRVGPILSVPVLRSGTSAHGASGLGVRPIFPSVRVDF